MKPAEVAREETKHGADNAADHDSRESDDDGDPRAVEDPPEDVAAEMVGAEPVGAPLGGSIRARRLEPLRDVLHQWIEGREDGRQEGGHGDGDDDDQAEERGAAPDQPPEERPGLAAGQAGSSGARARRRRRRHGLSRRRRADGAAGISAGAHPAHRRSAQPDPRVEPGVDQIDRKVDQHEGRRR